ncbi:MAG: family 10 glycosylhydrolase [Microcystis aeruginosa L111-01]|jgi:uncharacterized lipoprotein YddW (UPF0748 family)|uniref:Family 10 glycosylhydrolase n=1 Tax=Microcystis aeruginosa G11-04 TaxID=2685956 RepID=A0A966FWZ1_MICAE|nr:family 10 glycosylhydrolase [Microcystis sp. LSC13-02]NCR20621.1 family 10 glycosylhydrolase [Microcystis aeruginosa L111-01]NCS42369.1 family 10 glycosylhydrolase [Microcystis aeruginosa BS11-05]NCS52341.1 family 10 glycosylhydrolase [Microcystis aeruginosa G13-05]NCS56044.1 family 10 glycosylhydrolase [Microcystis aeruginosa G11-04]
MAQGKITASSLNLRSQPDSTTDGNIIKPLPTGTLVEIIKTVRGSSYTFGGGTRNDWTQVTEGTDTGFVAAAWVAPITPPPLPPSITTEVRGVWIVDRTHSSVLTSPATISNALNFLQRNGFNTVCPAVWNRGFTAFPSTVMTKNGFPNQDPGYVGFDPLREIVKQGKSRGMMVFPWFEYGFAASPDADGGHILETKPNWSALDSSGNKVQHGGLTWMNALNPEVQQFMLDLILEVVNTYDVDGIQGCDRFPAIPFNGGYDQATKDKYKAKHGVNPPSDGKDPIWIKFRADILTKYLASIFEKIKSTKSTCIVSMSPSPFPFGLNNLMQDSEVWVKQEIVDFLHPQLYRTSFANYKTEVDSLKTRLTASQLKKIAPGIAFTASRTILTTSDIVQSIKYNRSQGLGGQIFFFYEGLTSNSNAMAIALQAPGIYA